jgi:hypothetical protein
VNGDRRWMSMNKRSDEEILKWINLLSLQAGNTEPIRYRKNWHTESPSIQNPWTPFTHQNPVDNLQSYPSESAGTILESKETATEKLMRLMNDRKANESSKE